MSDIPPIHGEIQMDVGPAVNNVNRFNNSLSQMEHAVATNWWGIRNLAAGFAALPAAVSAGVAASVKSASELEDALVGVARTSGLVYKGDQFTELQNDLLAIGRIRATPTVEILGIAESAGALGVAQEDIARFTKTIVDFTQLTGVESEKAATSIARNAALTGVGAAGYDNYASSVYRAGVSTAATEDEILDISNRMAGAASGIGLSADQIIGWAAAVRSAGERSEAGGTSLQSFFQQINGAVRGQTEELAHWAAFTGKSTEAFSDAFRNDANGALVEVIKGMGNTVRSGGNLIGMLNDAGVTEQRRIRTLTLLALAQSQNVNQNAKLTSALAEARTGFEDTSDAEQRTRERTDTLSAQLGILRNIIQQAGASFGNSFLGPLKAVIGFMGALVTGISSLPGPLRMGLALLTGLATIVLGLGAAFLLIGPRIIIALGSLRQLSEIGLKAAFAMLTGKQSLDAASNASQRFSAATARTNQKLAEEERDAIAAANAIAILSGSHLRGKAAIDAYHASQTAENIELQKTSRWAGFAAKAIGAVSVATAVLAIQSYRNGKAQQEATARIEAASGPNSKLVKIMRDQKSAINDTTQGWLAQQGRYKAVAKTAGDLGVDMQKVNRIITGEASGSEFADTMKEIDSAAAKAGTSSKGLSSDTEILFRMFKASKEEAGVLAKQLDGTADANFKTGKSAKDAAKGLKDEHDAMEKLAQAHIDAISAGFDLRQAQFDLAEATKDLHKAQTEAAGSALEIEKAELAVTKAQQDSEAAARDLEGAQRDLATARARQASDVADAEDALADSQDNLYDAQQKVLDLEEKMAELRNGPTMRDLIAATNKLRDAQLRLQESEQGVKDAEWQLQYLRNEGASARDISDAEFTLAESRQEVANNTEDLSDAERALNDLTDPAAQAKRVADAERDLASARRDVEEAVRKIAGAERELNQARADAAADSYYVEAQQKILDAQIAQKEAANAIRDAELDLAELRGGSATQEAEEAQLRYEEALWRVATAQADVAKQAALMRGEDWNAGRQADALAAALQGLGVETDSAIAKRQEWLNILAKAPDVPPAKATADADPNSDIDLTPEFGDEMGGTLEPEYKFEPRVDVDKQSLWEQLLPLGGMLVGMLGPTLITGMGAAFTALAAAAPAIIAALPFIIIGLLIAGLVAALIMDRNWAKLSDAIWQAMQKAWDVLSDIGVWIWQHILYPALSMMFPLFTGMGRDMLRGLWDGLVEAAGTVLGGIGRWLYDKLIAPIRNVFRIHSPSGVFADIGVDMIMGLWNGIQSAWNSVVSFFSGLGSSIIGMFSNAFNWLTGAGSDILGGLWNGLVAGWHWISGFGQKVWTTITSPFSNAMDWLSGMGQNILSGLVNGITWAWKNVFVPVWNKVIDMIPGSFADGMKIGSPSKIFDTFGNNLIQGLTNGISDSMPSLMAQLDEVVKATGQDLTDELAKYRLDYLVGAAGLGSGMGDIAAMNTLDNRTIIYQDNLNLEAITTADPDEIVNSYVWSKRIRTRN